jgi:hypothetical protein
MSRTVFAFFDLDAAPQHGVTGDLATRLGAATGDAGFIDGAVYARSDHAAVALQLQSGEESGWAERGAVATLIQAAQWRSRDQDVRAYQLARRVAGDGDGVRDSTFYIVQRFVVSAGKQAALVAAVCDHADRFAGSIPGFLGGDAYTSLDGTRVVFVMPWAHEAALNALENGDGSLAAMQTYLRMSERYSYESYERVSYLRGATARSV